MNIQHKHLRMEDSSISLSVSTCSGQIISAVFQYMCWMGSKKKSLQLSLLDPEI